MNLTTAFSNEILDGQAQPLSATYSCPRCPEQVSLQKRDFEPRAARRISNLSPSLQHASDQWAARHGEAGKPFLDWSCPGCGLAVHVYADPWAGGHFGDGGVDVTVVLEAEST